tara:strand:+ start:625 stop:822 length:198 start_codon:yes stop_codon:yes gene_type:complete
MRVIPNNEAVELSTRATGAGRRVGAQHPDAALLGQLFKVGTPDNLNCYFIELLASNVRELLYQLI